MLGYGLVLYIKPARLHATYCYVRRSMSPGKVYMILSGVAVGEVGLLRSMYICCLACRQSNNIVILPEKLEHQMPTEYLRSG